MDMEQNLDARLSAVERWRSLVEVSLAEFKIDKGYINKRFDSIEDELKEIKTTGKRLNMMIIGAVIAYVVKFAFDGGFHQVIS